MKKLIIQTYYNNYMPMVLSEKQQTAVLVLALVACASLFGNICLIKKCREQEKTIQKQEAMLLFCDSPVEFPDSLPKHP